MATGYKIKNADIDTIFETFTLAEKSTYKIPDSKFTDGDNDYKHRGSDLGASINIPTSAGNNYASGQHLIQEYKKANNSIDVALKGRRPVGKPLLEFNTNNDRNQNRNAGWYTIYRQNGKTYYAAGNNVTTGGTLLDPAHNPEYLHIELCGGGGGSAGNSNYRGGGGGGGGAYIFLVVKCDKIIIKIGNGGKGGQSWKVGTDVNDARGRNGSNTCLFFDYNGYTYKVVASGGNYGAPPISDVDNKSDGGPLQIHSQWCGPTSTPWYSKKTYNGNYDEAVDNDIHWENGTYAKCGDLYEREDKYVQWDKHHRRWEELNGVKPKDQHPEKKCKPIIIPFNNEIPLDVCHLIDTRFGGFGLARDAEGPGFQAFVNSWNEQFNRPEPYTFTLGPCWDGYNGDYGYGGGGGPSVFESGAQSGKRINGRPGNRGAGASGGSYDNFKNHNGAEGGFGIVRIYY